MTPGSLLRKRLTGLMAIIALLFFVLIGRFVYLQVFEAGWLQERGESQWLRERTVNAHRGKILDATGKALAQSATTYTITASPQDIERNGDAQALAAIFAEYFDLDAAELAAKFKDTSRKSVQVQRQVERDTVEALRALRQEYAEDISAKKKAGLTTSANPLYGVYYTEDYRRYYPMGQALAQTLGITNVDGDGQTGLEAKYNEQLSGTPGRERVEVDGNSREVGGDSEVLIEVQHGNDIQLTIDYVIQSFAEKALEECLAETGAQRAICIVQDVNTGGILAMTGKPDFDPNAPPRSDAALLNDVLHNRAVESSYEAGNLIGTITLSAALDSGLLTLDGEMDCDGDAQLQRKTIECYLQGGHGDISFREALCANCDVALADIAQRYDTETLYGLLQAYGFGAKTGIDLPSESAGRMVKRKYATQEETVLLGMGKSGAASPLQLITALSAVVNGGNLMQPYVVSHISDADGAILQSTQPVVKAHPINESASDTMREMLLGVVEDGNGSNARVAGYSVGGVGSVLRKYVDGKLDAGSLSSAFVAAAPMEDPQVAVIIIVEDAASEEDYAFALSAPYAARILEQALPYMGIAPSDENAALEKAVMPNIVGMRASDAQKALESAGLVCVLDAHSGTVRAQLPAQGAEMRRGDVAMAYTRTVKRDIGTNYMATVPDVTGLNIYRAHKLLKSAGFTLKIEGDSGYALRQSPIVGSALDMGGIVTVYFDETRPTPTPEKSATDAPDATQTPDSTEE